MQKIWHVGRVEGVMKERGVQEQNTGVKDTYGKLMYGKENQRNTIHTIIIMEYNSVFGAERAITVPYRKDFDRTKAHYSTLFFGASLNAFNYALSKKGYSLVGCNIAGNNAYFVRKELLNEKVREIDFDSAFKESKFRESRNYNNSKSLITGDERLNLIRGLEVINVLTNEKEKL